MKPPIRFMINEKFFTIKPEKLISMIESKTKLYGKNKTIDDIAHELHRNLRSGSFESTKDHLLCHEISQYKNIDWNNANIYNLYRDHNKRFYGSNSTIEDNRKSIREILWANMNDKTLVLLFFAALLSLSIGFYKMAAENDKLGWIEGVSILLAVVLIVMLGTVNEYSQERLFNRLDKKRQIYKIKVYENSQFDTRNSLDIIVGDVCFFEPGDIIPADCVMISDELVITDEAMISGESDPVYKSFNEDPYLISGTYVIEGSTKAIVLCVGKNSVKGKIIQQMTVKDKKTPLEIKIADLSQNLARKAFYIALILLTCHMLKLPYLKEHYHMSKILALIIESISIIVMAVPEGLPMAVTLALSFGTKRMLLDNNLVRDISACETMNNTNYICTDKTGTLTYNEMSIKYIFAGNIISHINERPYDKDNDLFVKLQRHSSLDLTLKNMILNSSAFENSDGLYIGSKSESAILKVIKAQNIDYNYIRREFDVLKRKTFSSANKYMSSIIKYKDQYIVLYKGAPEKIAEYCHSEMVNDKLIKFSHENLVKFIKKCDNKYYRTMAYSYAILDDYDPGAIELGKTNCTFLCAIAMEDPLRENVKTEIEHCKKAGINIVMLTGDKISLAKSLAQSLGIYTSGTICMSGHTFRQKTDAEVLSIIDKVKVIGRASPGDKKRFVELLQQKGNVVAVTGDGTNDGPALKTADIGFGMGISGTDIAKEASSIILMNDDFSSLVKSIKWGRCINNSVRKFIQFQLTATITTIVIAIISSLMCKPGKSTFTPLKLLWINIVMDTFAALALSTDKPGSHLLERNPEPKNAPIITYEMKLFMFCSAIWQFIVIGYLFIISANSTYIFNTFVFLQLFNEINARSLNGYESPFSGLLDNKIFVVTNLIVIVLQYLIVNHMGLVFKTQPLKFAEWATSILLASTIVLYFVAVRAVYRHMTDKDKNTKGIKQTVGHLQVGMSNIDRLKT